MSINLEDSISRLGLSVRANNCLDRSNIKTIEQLLKKPNYEIEKIYGIGAKTLKEIKDIKIELEYKLGGNFSNTLIEDKEEIIFIRANDGKSYQDIKLEDLGLSVRSYNCLKGSGINYYSEILNLSDEHLMSIRNFGVTSLKEIHDLRDSTILKEVNNSNNRELLTPNNRSYISLLANFFGLNANEIILDLLNKYEEEFEESFIKSKEIKNIELFDMLMTLDCVKDSYKKFILKKINESTYGLLLEDIEILFPEKLRYREHLYKVLDKLLEKGEIDFVFDDRIMIKRQAFNEGGKEILTKREFNVFLNRIEGRTLEEIGEIFEVTRERIRQIEAKAKRKLSHARLIFYEDIYKNLFLKYELSKEDFYVVFGNHKIFNYLNMRYGKNNMARIDSKELLYDKEIPREIRHEFEKAVYKNYVRIGNSRVKKERGELINYFLKHYAREEIHFDDFKQIYLEEIENLGLSEVGNIGFIDRGIENRIMSSEKVLWKFGKRLRYYNLESYDFSELLDVLDLNQYMDVEYSSLKFFRDYPELMKNYDIRDEYELHNLLKKICREEDYPYVKFNRMPNIEFGIADRDRQVEELLFSLAPISYYDFADEYEREYGVNANTVMANYLNGISKYLFNYEYKVDFPDIEEENKSYLKSYLDKDFYFMEDILKKLAC